MRVALQVVAVLEGARLALVDVDRHQTRRGPGRHRLPLAARRKAGAAEAAQARVFHRRDDFVPRSRAVDAGSRQFISALLPIGGIVDVARRHDVEMRMRRRRRPAAGASRRWPEPAPPPSRRSRAEPDSDRRPRPARSRTGRRRARAGRERPGRAAAGNAASSSREPAISHAMESQTRTVIAGGAVAVLHHVEMVIERGHFVDFGHRHLHFGRERDQVRARRGSRSDPESGADARSADPVDAGHCREARARPRAPADRPGGLSGPTRARLSACLFFGIALSFYSHHVVCGLRDRAAGAGRRSGRCCGARHATVRACPDA